MTEKNQKIEKFMFWGLVVPALILLGVVLSQPAWNSKKMIAQITSDCSQRHGILIVDHEMFGDDYSCESRLDK